MSHPWGAVSHQLVSQCAFSHATFSLFVLKAVEFPRQTLFRHLFIYFLQTLQLEYCTPLPQTDLYTTLRLLHQLRISERLSLYSLCSPYSASSLSRRRVRLDRTEAWCISNADGGSCERNHFVTMHGSKTQLGSHSRAFPGFKNPTSAGQYDNIISVS